MVKLLERLEYGDPEPVDYSRFDEGGLTGRQVFSRTDGLSRA